jgi:two-component system cell cycle sensor histidine kinase/response regulator CckA
MDSKNNILGDGESYSIANDAVLRSLRKFSGTVSHDFNNLLTILMAYPQLIRRDLPAGCQGHSLLDTLERNTAVMVDISSRLAQFAAPAYLSEDPVELDAVVLEILADLEKDGVTSGITIISDIDSACIVNIPKNTLGRIIKEVCVNACDAMGASGTLKVATALFKADNAVLCYDKVVPAGEYVAVTISDTGGGISAGDISKTIEPFFVAHKKNHARGAGLGLSIVYSVITDCGGYLILENKDGGLFVSMLLPLDVSESDPVDKGDADKKDDKLSKSRVLVVDDEEEIVELFKLLLETEIGNLDIDSAYNGREAVDLFKLRHHDLIITDLHMPVLDGYQAFKEISELCASEEIQMPGFIFCTGYIPPQGVRQAVAKNPRNCFLQKPVTPSSMIAAARERLPV